MAKKYLAMTDPAYKDAINTNNFSMLKLAVLVSEFAQHMAVAHELFSKEVRSVVATFKRRSYELKRERPTDTPCSIFTAWEKLLQETEMDAQAHLDAAGLLIKNVHRPLQEVASHKTSQTRQLIAFRELLENLIQQTESNLDQVQEAFQKLVRSLLKGPREDDSERMQAARTELYSSHNDYFLCLRATNRTAEEFQRVLPEVLEELEEIYIDTSNTVNVAIEGHALLMLTKASEQHRRFEEQLKMCRQVNPQLDVTCFVAATKSDSSSDVTDSKRHFCISPGDLSQLGVEVGRNQLLLDQSTIVTLEERRLSLQRRGMELLSAIKQSQDRNNAYVNACQRSLAKHQYAKVYETQEDMCRKRNEIRVATLQLAAIKAQMELLTHKQNGSVTGLAGEGEVEGEEQEGKKEHTATIKGLWKKAFKNLKSGDQKWLTKKSGSLKRRDSKEAEEPEPEEPKEIDPVYSLLKCAADLPRVVKPSKDSSCTGLLARHGDSSGSTSKASSPSSSASHSPKTRRKKLNARMKSFSLDTPDPPKQLLSIDETTKKKSSSFTNTCFGATGSTSPSEPINASQTMSASTTKKKLGWSHRSSSLEIEDRKIRSHSLSPSGSPKSKKKDLDTFIVLYHFRGKEKDDMDLRAGTRISVTNSSDPDWWKGKYNGKSGYFPAKYVLRIEPGQQIYQVLRTINLTEMDGLSGIRLHKDQIVFQAGGEIEGLLHVRSASNRECMCPIQYLIKV